jgi:hypothetical protein
LSHDKQLEIIREKFQDYVDDVTKAKAAAKAKAEAEADAKAAPAALPKAPATPTPAEIRRAAAMYVVESDVRISAAETVGASKASVRIAPPVPDAANFRERLEGKFANTGILTNTSGISEASPGEFEVYGDLTPASLKNVEEGLAGLRTTIETFLTEEATTFGILDLADLREVWMGIGPTGVGMAEYRRYIGGLRLEGAHITLTVNPEGRIRKITGRLPPVPDALYEAVRQPILTVDEVKQVALDDQGTGLEIRDLPTIFAISDPPYVIWKVNAGMQLTIDAFTGEVLERQRRWMH